MEKIQKHTMIWVVALAFGLLLSSCEKGDESKQLEQPPQEVGVVTLKKEPVELSVELPGRTAAFRIAEVRPQVSGIIQKRLFTEGSVVEAGQLLYQIDPATYQAAYDSAKAALAKAKAKERSDKIKADRYRVLVRTKAVSEQEQIEMEATWKQSVADVAAAKAALDAAKINLNYTKVTAPISGRIGKSQVTEGALVTAQQGSALATIQQLDPMYVDVNQSSTELIRLKREVAAGLAEGGEQPHSAVTVILDDGTEYGETGNLEFSDVTVNQTTGTVTLRALVANPQQELLPGMFVRARIDKGLKPDALLVPAVSIQRNAKSEATVMVVDKNSMVATKIIETDQNIGKRVLVTKGLQAGEQIIVSGLQKVRVGMPVKPVQEEMKPSIVQTGPVQTGTHTE
ncbi:efflux RND transporter periplasmic adaptor subunit [Desulfobulbus rhabdoformis]|nr:efflux RND transporter periplasmic adaptor subunit [Desulfobulbus rhabdoformis]MBM9614967.1 efflux RND transporter periplasmic adaptor subunit [Desulfobulbus rhabdoformis]